MAGVQRTVQRVVSASAPPAPADGRLLRVRDAAQRQPAQQDLTAAVQVGTQRVEPQVPLLVPAPRCRARAVRARPAPPRRRERVRCGERRARRGPLRVADEDPLQRPGDGAAAARSGSPCASTVCTASTSSPRPGAGSPRSRARSPATRRISRASAGPDGWPSARSSPVTRTAQRRAVLPPRPGRPPRPGPVLPLRVPDAGRIAGPGVEQRVRVRDQGDGAGGRRREAGSAGGSVRGSAGPGLRPTDGSRLPQVRRRALSRRLPGVPADGPATGSPGASSRSAPALNAGRGRPRSPRPPRRRSPPRRRRARIHASRRGRVGSTPGPVLLRRGAAPSRPGAPPGAPPRGGARGAGLDEAVPQVVAVAAGQPATHGVAADAAVPSGPARMSASVRGARYARLPSRPGRPAAGRRRPPGRRSARPSAPRPVPARSRRTGRTPGPTPPPVRAPPARATGATRLLVRQPGQPLLRSRRAVRRAGRPVGRVVEQPAGRRRPATASGAVPRSGTGPSGSASVVDGHARVGGHGRVSPPGRRAGPTACARSRSRPRRGAAPRRPSSRSSRAASAGSSLRTTPSR